MIFKWCFSAILLATTAPALPQDDILLTSQAQTEERNAASDLGRRWTTGPDGVSLVPYRFMDGLINQAVVKAGIKHWEEHTCIHFEPNENETRPHLQFYLSNECYSIIGMHNSNGQVVTLGGKCNTVRDVIRMIAHAIGFHYEHTRSDRDDYVQINTVNIRDDQMYKFQKHTSIDYSIPYDLSAITHFSSRSYSNNGGVTIATNNPLDQEVMGQGEGLSHYDKLLANTMYQCIVKWLDGCDLSSNPCQNDGYIGSNCECVCRDGTSGTYCQKVDHGYYDKLRSGCSEKVDKAGTLTSPNYPSNYECGLRCVKWILAPMCHTVNITFNSFKLHSRTWCGGEFCCADDALEIRTNRLYNSEMYCETDISPGTRFNSPSKQLILYFETKTNFYRGWTLDVAFVPDSGCT